MTYVSCSCSSKLTFEKLYKKHQKNAEKLSSVILKAADITQCASPTPWKMWSIVARWIFPAITVSVVILTRTPDPRMPPKYQTCSVMCSFFAGFPPGKKSRMLHSTHTIDRGIRLIPRHLAKLPEHILTLTLRPPLLVTTPWVLKVYCGLLNPT